MTTKRYILMDSRRNTRVVMGAPVYLRHVINGGLTTKWVIYKDEARKFTAAQRAAFERMHAHIRGRWMLA